MLMKMPIVVFVSLPWCCHSNDSFPATPPTLYSLLLFFLGAREECPADGGSSQLPAQFATVGGGSAGAAARGDRNPPAAAPPALRPDGGSGRRYEAAIHIHQSGAWSFLLCLQWHTAALFACLACSAEPGRWQFVCKEHWPMLCSLTKLSTKMKTLCNKIHYLIKGAHIFSTYNTLV